jgi:hypothetical protein
MAGTNQFYPIATDSSANVLSNASWQASNVRQTGFKSGIMPSNGLNIALRQGTALSSAIGSFIASQGYDALDNGDLATLQANFKSALVSSTAQAPNGRGLVSFTTPGPGTWTVPSVAAGNTYNVYWIYATAVGGGGGGSGTTTAGPTTTSGGGGAGETRSGWMAVTPGQVINFVVGAGSPGVGYGINSSVAGSSSIGSSITAIGGAGTGNGGVAGGGGGANGSGGQVALPGGNGLDGNLFTANAPGGGGGASSQGGGGRASTVPAGSVTNGRAPGSGGGGLYSAQNTGVGGNGANGLVSFQY